MQADGLDQGASTTIPTTATISVIKIEDEVRRKRYSSPAETYGAESSRSDGVPKSRSCYEYSSNGRVAVRHRNAEEALSSLLWQPYECRGSPPLSLVFGGDIVVRHSPAVGRDGETCATEMRIQVPAAAHQAAADCDRVVVTTSVDKTCSGNNCAQQCSAVSVNGEVMSSCRTTARQQQQQQQQQIHQQQNQQQQQQQLLQLPPQPQTAAALLPPPYSTLPPPHAHHPIALPVQPHGYPFQPISLRRCQYGEESEGPKTCCGGLGARTLGLRWFIAVVALAGVCCVLVGTVLGAVRAHGRAHLTVLLVMIGVGLVLVTVSGVAWRAAGRRANSVTGGNRTGSSGPRRSALPCARAHHPYAAMLYPEFHCRPPPPSYQASMHEYRLRLLLLDRATSPPPMCPPPAYRPRRMANNGPRVGARGRHRPEQQAPQSTLSAVVIQNIGLESYDDIKYDEGPEIEAHIVSDSKDDVQPENKEGNLVTIVQTGEDTSPVIVTVSGSLPEERPQVHASEIDILAHL